MLNEEAAVLRAGGDSKNRQQERDPLRTINGEQERVQGHWQGQAGQRQEGGDDNG